MNGMALLAAIALFFEFSPKIAVSLDQPLDLSDAFSSPFMVANDGYLPLNEVSARCALNQVDFARNRFKNIVVASHIDIAAEMLPGEKLTVKCRFRETIGVADSDTFENADISIAIEYRLWFWPNKRQREFRFISAHASDGSWHWLPQPISK